MDPKVPQFFLLCKRDLAKMHTSQRLSSGYGTYARVVAPIQTTFTCLNGSPPPRSSPTVVSDPEWETHPLYGLVHTLESCCSTCQEYVLHLRDAKEHPGDGSFRVALRTLHDNNDRGYDEGFMAGYEKAKQDAIRQVSLSAVTTTETRATGVVVKPVLAPVAVTLTSETAHERKVIFRMLSHPNGIDSPSPQPFDDAPVESSGCWQLTHNEIAALRQSHPQVYPRGRGKYRVPEGYNSAFRSVSVEKHLRDLFEAAWNGDENALSRVRSLAREAHNTARERKSWGQKFVLAEWRNPVGPNPRYSHTSHPTTGVANPRLDSPIEEWENYYTIHSVSLPRGVRRDAKGGPYLPDLRASRHYAAMRPPTSSPTIMRMEYTVFSMELIIERDRYSSILRNTGLQVAPQLVPVPYDGPQKVTEDEVARHFARCGVTDDLLKREWLPWAREHQAPREHPADE
ncbi:hypothetical protein PM082_016350 [Marasmius tenuissimus]|nr:hypothetical protein PM082_016350 [Marasmius tenuissimus]